MILTQNVVETTQKYSLTFFPFQCPSPFIQKHDCIFIFSGQKRHHGFISHAKNQTFKTFKNRKINFVYENKYDAQKCYLSIFFSIESSARSFICRPSRIPFPTSSIRFNSIIFSLKLSFQRVVNQGINKSARGSARKFHKADPLSISL